MKNITKWLLVVLMVVLIPAKHFGQTPYRQYAEDGITLDFSQIDNVYFRTCLLYLLNHNDQFVLTQSEDWGQFSINPNDENSCTDFYEAFETFYNNAFTDFGFLSKTDLDELMPFWKDNIPPTHFLSMTMDLVMRNNRPINNHCVDSDPFCTSDLITFDAATSSQTANELEGYDFDDGCIGFSYNPSWYHMRINVAGQFVIHMEGHDPNNGTNRDIDFCIWGPYLDPTSPCVAQLTENMIIDCCYSSSYSEDIYLGYPEGEHHHNSGHGTIHYHVPEVGEYYILMITNYSQAPCTISFTKDPESGPGETDCGILPGIATNGGPYCVGETIYLFVNSQAGATYSWSGPNGFTSTVQNPTIPNCTFEMGGTYTCITTVDGQTTSGSTEVIVYAEPVASFEAETVCEGEATHFTSTATTAPPGHIITGYHWDFGDGETADVQDTTHVYAAAGTYQVTHTVQTGHRCEDEITQTVVVLAMPNPTITADPSSVQYGGTATLTVNPGAEGSFSYHWEPANMVTNPNSQTTQTLPIQESVTFTCTVTNNDGDCGGSAQVTVNMAGSDLTATATADQYEICDGESTTLHAVPHNGTGTYTYSWSPANLLNGTTTQNPVATPPLGETTFHCSVSDGLTTQEVNVTIMVHPNEENDLYESICRGESFSFFGQNLTAPGTYNHVLHTQYGCDSTLHLHLSYYETYDMPATSVDTCDSYLWLGETLTRSGSYTRTLPSEHGCDSIVHLDLELHYSPAPSEIYPTDPDNVAPHWVITATEFQINNYEFSLYDTVSPEPWDSVRWEFEDPSIEWLLERETEPYLGKKCKMYVLNYIEDTIWVIATPFDECDRTGQHPQRYWFVCSFYGVDENGSSTSSETFDFNVVPNPNNGQMTLNFGKATGKVDMKVYDMMGNLVDQFETYSANGPNSMIYNMKDRPNGIYVFVATAREGMVTKKVVIQQ